MPETRLIEIFSAGCRVCDQAVHLVNELACESCEVVVLDMRENDVAQRAEALGIRSLPAILVDGTLATCCVGRGPDRASLEEAGIGTPIG